MMMMVETIISDFQKVMPKERVHCADQSTCTQNRFWNITVVLVVV